MGVTNEQLFNVMQGCSKEISDVKVQLAGVKTEVSSVKTDIAEVKHDVSKVKDDVFGVKKDVSILNINFGHHLTNGEADKIRFRWTLGIIIGVTVPIVTMLCQLAVKYLLN